MELDVYEVVEVMGEVMENGGASFEKSGGVGTCTNGGSFNSLLPLLLSLSYKAELLPMM